MGERVYLLRDMRTGGGVTWADEIPNPGATLAKRLSGTRTERVRNLLEMRLGDSTEPGTRNCDQAGVGRCFPYCYSYPFGREYSNC